MSEKNIDSLFEQAGAGETGKLDFDQFLDSYRAGRLQKQMTLVFKKDVTQGIDLEESLQSIANKNQWLNN